MNTTMAGRGLTPAQQLVAALADGYKPTPKEFKQLAYELHGAMVDEPIMDRMAVSFETLGDAVCRAIREDAEAANDAQKFFNIRNTLETA